MNTSDVAETKQTIPQIFLSFSFVCVVGGVGGGALICSRDLSICFPPITNQNVLK